MIIYSATFTVVVKISTNQKGLLDYLMFGLDLRCKISRALPLIVNIVKHSHLTKNAFE